MTLSIINDNPAALTAAQSGDWTACVSALNSDTVTVRDDTGWKLGDISDKWGDDAARVVSGTIDTAGQSDPLAKAAWTALLSEDGLRLHTDGRQTLIDQLAAIGWNGQSWSDELRDGIKALGVQAVSRWKQATGTEPTAQSVQATWQQHLVDTLNGEIAAGLNESVYPASSTADRVAVATALRALADSIEAG